MNVALEFHDSDVAVVERSADSVTVTFAKAYLHYSNGRPGYDAGLGYLQKARLSFHMAHCSGLSPDCSGALSDGSLSVNERSFRLLPVPFAETGTVVARLEFNTGATLSINAESVCLHLDGMPSLLDRFDA